MPVLIIAGLTAVLLFTGCRSVRGYDEESIYVGELVSLTGPESTFGVSAHQAVTLAVEEINAAGGLEVTLDGIQQKRKIKLITLDTGSHREIAEEAATELIESREVLAIVGEVVSERTRHVAPVAQKFKIPIISPASTNPALTEIGDYVFRACYIDPFQGFVMAKFARGHLKLNRIAVLKDYRSNYSAGLSEYFVDTFTNLGGQIVSEQTYATTDSEFSKQLSELKKIQPDAVFIPGYYSQVAEIAKQIRRLQIRSRQSGQPTLLLGGDGWDSSELYKLGGKAVLGAYFTNHFTPGSKTPETQNFVRAYKERYAQIPDGIAAVSYDAVGILSQALTQAFRGHSNQPKRAELAALVRSAMAATKDYQGVTGKISLNENRDAVKPAVVNKVERGSMSYVTTVTP